MSSECHQSVIRVSSQCLHIVFRVCQSVFNIEVISSSSASSVSIFGIFSSWTNMLQSRKKYKKAVSEHNRLLADPAELLRYNLNA